MHSDMICLVALDFILWIVLAGMVDVPFVINIVSMNLDDRPTHLPGFGIP